MNKLTGNYRRYRFQPLAALEARDRGEQDPFPQGFEEGLRQGQERGLEQGLAEGKSQGFEAGYQEGLTRGEQAGRETFLPALESLALLQHALESLRRQEMSDHTDNLCALVEQVARRVIHAELTLNPNQLEKLVAEALGRMDARTGPVSIYLSPDDHQRLAKTGTSAIGDYPILADESLSTGDCRLESEHQTMTVKSEERLKHCVARVREELEQENDA